ncbi:hypothetical protein ACWGPT_18385 [Pseudorhizobium sp. NPDC055634]
MADEDLLEIFSVDDLSVARQALLRSLPHISVLRAWFSGEFSPTTGKPPEYVRILVFLCWMQTTKTRIRGDRDFRELLEKQFGERFQGSNMSGLNRMWEHLRDYLAREHAIDLVLPGIHPHSQIGRTLRIAFPTWRDRAAFRKLRGALPDALLLDPLQVSNRIRTSRHLIGETMQSFEYNFAMFERARKRGGREYMETPFWQAWYSIVAEQAALEDLEVAEGDFGEHELFRVSPLGDRVAIATPEEALRYVPKPLAKLIRGGTIFLENLGYGRYRASSSTASNILLMRSSKLQECDKDVLRSVRGLNSGWVVATFRFRIDDGGSPDSTPREFAWRDGIRVGGAYLGRPPLAPLLIAPLQNTVRVEKSGKQIEMTPCEQGLSLPRGIHSGTFTAHYLREKREVLLVPRANEVGDIRRLDFDFSREVSEDEFHRDTAPSPERGIENWNGERVPPCDDLITISEALYERSARGMSFSEAIEIVLRVTAGRNAPSEWDLLRSFADAGWIELTLLRHFPARRILQNPVEAECIGGNLVRISGPTPIAVVERLHSAAEASGTVVEIWNGASPWALPRYVIRSTSERSRQDFIRRMAIQQRKAPQPAVPDLADTNGVHGYDVIGRLDEDRGYFAVRFGDATKSGLYRLERKESRNPFLYRSILNGRPPQNYVSASVAILSHHLRNGGNVFVHQHGVITSTRPRLLMPSSWARWMSDRILCNPGPMPSDDKWMYAYPVGQSSLAALSALVTISDAAAPLATPWVQLFLSSASNRGRAVYDGRTRTVHTVRSMSGKR